jgi:YHS domain-containing protein
MPMTLRMTAAITAALLVVSVHAQQREPVEALDGVDPVLLLQTGRETFGKSVLSSRHGGFTYLFATTGTKAAFDADPARFVIQMNGVCARMGSGRGNPSNYAVVDGRIYIFASEACRTAFVAAPARFLPPPAAAFAPTAEAEAQGRRLLDQAAAAHGGQALDGLNTYSESYLEVRRGGPPDPPRVTTTWRFPDAARSERTFSIGARTLSVATLLTGSGGWNGPVDAAPQPVDPVALPGLRHQLGRLLIPLLRTRHAAGTAVGALRVSTVNGASVWKVRLLRDGLDLVVNIAPSSGRVLSTEFLARGQDAAWGRWEVLYEDYRTVDGVLVPFRENVLFDGAASADLSRSLQSVAMNPAIDPAKFTAGSR